MKCPQCSREASWQDIHCPGCGVILASLLPGTRLYHRFVLKAALTRSEVIQYAAQDESNGQSVVIQEFLPRGTVRMGQLAILPANRKEDLRTWLQSGKWFTQQNSPFTLPLLLTFEQHGTGYLVTPQSSVPVADTQAASPNEVLAALRSALRGLALRHDDGVFGRIELLQDEMRVIIGPTSTLDWPAPLQAPESALGQGLTPATDIYALGALFWGLLTGRPIPDAPQRTLGYNLPSLPSDTPAGLRQALHAALQLDPTFRPASAELFLALLDEHPEHDLSVFSWQRKAHRSAVTHLSVSGPQLVSSGPDHQVIVHNASGHELERYVDLQGKPVGLVTAGTAIVAADSASTLHCWLDNFHREVRTPAPVDFLLPKSAQEVITIYDDASVGLWQLETLQAKGQAQSGVEWPSAAASWRQSILIGNARGQLWSFSTQSGQTTLFSAEQWNAPVSAILPVTGGVLFATGRHVVQAGMTKPAWTFNAPVTALVLWQDRIVAASGQQLWVLEGGQPPHELAQLPETITVLACMQQQLVVGTSHGLIAMTNLDPETLSVD